MYASHQKNDMGLIFRSAPAGQCKEARKASTKEAEVRVLPFIILPQI